MSDQDPPDAAKVLEGLSNGSLSKLTTAQMLPLFSYLFQRIQQLESAQLSSQSTIAELQARIFELEATETPGAPQNDGNSPAEKPQQMASYSSVVASSQSSTGQPAKKSTPKPTKQQQTQLLETETGFQLVESKKKRTVAVKGTVVSSADNPISTFSALSLNSAPKRDFCLRGLPRDVKKETVEQHLKSHGITYRFVDVHVRKDDDRRGTTFARIGTTVEFSDKILDPAIWTTNVSVRPWTYLQKASLPKSGNGK